MKQFNVRDDTHALGRSLSYETNKSLIVVVQEAMEMYEKSLKVKEDENENEDALANRLLNEAASVIVARICITISEVVREEVPKAVGEMIAKLQEERAKESERQAQLLRESEALPLASYEEVYGKGQDQGQGQDQEKDKTDASGEQD